MREKFDKYLPFTIRENLLSVIEEQILEWPHPEETVKACRDANNDKYLELAISCQASCIITGDKDLLVLNPFRNIPILNSAGFLNAFV